MRSCFEPVGSSDFFKCVLKQSSVNTFFSILAFSSFMEQGASITADKMCGQDCFLQKQNVYLLSFVITLVTLDSHKPVTESGTYRKSDSEHQSFFFRCCCRGVGNSSLTCSSGGWQCGGRETAKR